MKKNWIYIVFGLWILLAMPIASANTLIGSAKEYNPVTKEILIKNTFLGLFPTTDYEKIKLTSNTDQCLIDCSASGETILYEDGILFDDMQFKNIAGGSIYG
jgi:hypothetical protein